MNDFCHDGALAIGMIGTIVMSDDGSDDRRQHETFGMRRCCDALCSKALIGVQQLSYGADARF